MKVNIIKFTAVLALVFLVSVVARSSEEKPDIRFRSIIYFYPDTKEINIKHVENVFTDFEVVDELPKSALKPVVSFSMIKDVENLSPVPAIQYLSYFGRGLDKQQATRIQASRLALVIDVAYPMSASFLPLKAAAHSIFSYADAVDALIWDSETRELFSAEAWKFERVDSWSGSIPEVEDHTVIHAYKSDEGVRAITLGMVKFGFPDIVVNNFSWSLNQPMGNLINLVSQSLVEGFEPNKKSEINLKINNLQNTNYNKELLSSLKNNAEPEVIIQIGEGKWEEGDPDNYIIELLFHNIKGTSLSEKQDVLLSSLFGWQDQISYVKHNELINAASQRAKNILNKLREDFNNGLNPGEYIQVKAPFRMPDGGNEWMWVEVLSWEGIVIKGLLKNEPRHIPTLRGGSEVTVKQEDVFDYLRSYPDKTAEGNETGALITNYRD